MDAEFFKILGQVAGIGGISLGVLLLVFRDVVRRRIFPRLTKEQGYNLLRLIVVLVWLVALAGIGAWVWVSAHTSSAGDLGPVPSSDELVVYHAVNEDLARELTDTAEKEQGISLRMIGEQGGALELIRRAKQTVDDGGRVDVLLGGPCQQHLELADHNYLWPFPSSFRKALESRCFHVTTHSMAWHRGYLAILYNQELLPLPPEAELTWVEFIDQLRRKRLQTGRKQLILPSPLDASAGFSLICGFMFAFGSDTAVDMLRQLNEETLCYSSKFHDVRTLLVVGEASAIVDWVHDAQRKKESFGLGAQFPVVVPRQSSQLSTCASILQGCKDKGTAMRFLDFLLSAPVARVLDQTGHRYSSALDAPTPEGMRPLKSVAMQLLPMDVYSDPRWESWLQEGRKVMPVRPCQ